MGNYIDTMAFIKIHNIESVGYVFLVYALIDNKRLKYKVWIDVFVISYLILNIYPWLPETIRCVRPVNGKDTYTDLLKSIFFSFWSVVLVALMIDHKIKYNEKVL